jgi:hypothetical protein
VLSFRLLVVMIQDPGGLGTKSMKLPAPSPSGSSRKENPASRPSVCGGLSTLTRGVNNAYRINKDTVSIEVNGPGGIKLCCLIDADQLKDVKKLNGSWTARWQPSPKTYYVVGKNQGQFPGQSGTYVSLHRVLTNAPRGLDVDHVNHDGLDNRSANLRLATRSQNLLNRKGPQSNNKSGWLGVYFVREREREGRGRSRSGYVAQLRVDGRRYRSSIRGTPQEASAWYWSKRRGLGIPDSPAAPALPSLAA